MKTKYTHGKVCHIPPGTFPDPPPESCSAHCVPQRDAQKLSRLEFYFQNVKSQQSSLLYLYDLHFADEPRRVGGTCRFCTQVSSSWLDGQTWPGICNIDSAVMRTTFCLTADFNHCGVAVIKCGFGWRTEHRACSKSARPSISTTPCRRLWSAVMGRPAPLRSGSTALTLLGFRPRRRASRKSR